VQVGIRDLAKSEYDAIEASGGRVRTHFDALLGDRKASGETWGALADEIVGELPQKVWLSFDIDGLDPSFCPHTGTPVPGGLSFREACLLIKRVVKSGRRVVGFDLNEVAPDPGGDEWDANVGARLLYQLCGWTAKSRA
jgi:agmatinase